MITLAELDHRYMEAVRADNLNRRQLALRATYAQQNAAAWRAKGYESLAESAYSAARIHLLLLLEKGAKRR